MYTVTPLALLAALTGTVSAAVLDKRVCPHDNLLRCFVGTPSLAAPFCSSSAGVIVKTPTVYVASTPTVFATSSTSTTSTGSTTSTTSTTTTSSTTTATTTTDTYLTTTTALTTDTLLTTTTALAASTTTSVTTVTYTLIIFSFRKRAVEDGAAARRAAPKTSLACIANLKPSPSAISSACSCFSSEYTAPAVTITTAAEPTTIYLETATNVFFTTLTGTDTAIVTDTATSTSVATSITSVTVVSSSTATVTVPATITSMNLATAVSVTTSWVTLYSTLP